MTIAVIGAADGLSAAFRAEFVRRGHQIFADSGRKFYDMRTAVSFIKRSSPDAVICCGEHSNTDVPAVRNIAAICGKLGIAFMYISSAAVYGSRGDFSEDSSPAPVSVKGRADLLCESIIRSVCKKYYILRLPELIFGQGGSTDCVVNVLRHGAEKKISSADNSTMHCAVYADDAAEIAGDILSNGICGIYNCANRGEFTEFGFASEVFRHARLSGFDEYYDVSVTPTERPADSAVLRCDSIAAANIEPLNSWQDAAERYISGTLRNSKGW